MTICANIHALSLSPCTQVPPIQNLHVDRASVHRLCPQAAPALAHPPAVCSPPMTRCRAPLLPRAKASTELTRGPASSVVHGAAAAHPHPTYRACGLTSCPSLPLCRAPQTRRCSKSPTQPNRQCCVFPATAQRGCCLYYRTQQPHTASQQQPTTETLARDSAQQRAGRGRSALQTARACLAPTQQPAS